MSRWAGACVACAVACALAFACKPAPKPTPKPRGTGASSGDPTPAQVNLVRDLEATVLEGYSQLSLGNFEAYADTVADERQVVLVRMGPERDIQIGLKSAIDHESFRISPCAQVLSKNLEVHLSRDKSMGWTFDDVSCRVPDPFEGTRHASIPLRVTALYERQLDTWVLVMQHVSYALPAEDIVTWARAGRLRKPARIRARIDPKDGLRKQVRGELVRLLRDTVKYRERIMASDAEALVLWPGPAHEYHGSAILEAPSLEELFGPRATVRTTGLYIGVAASKKLAWVAANLEVTTTVSDDPIVIRLRATYIYELREDAARPWQQVQAHVSAPVVQADLSKRVFGLELPALSASPSPRQ